MILLLIFIGAIAILTLAECLLDQILPRLLLVSFSLLATLFVVARGAFDIASTEHSRLAKSYLIRIVEDLESRHIEGAALFSRGIEIYRDNFSEIDRLEEIGYTITISELDFQNSQDAKISGGGALP